jgi:tetratricopeptide (TPR) repeat protein
MPCGARIGEVMRSIISLLLTAVALQASSPNIYETAIHQAVDLSNTHRFAEALVVLTKAFEQATSNHETAWAALIQNNLGFVYERQGKYSDAEAAFYRALRGMAAAGRTNGSETAPIMGNLGALYYEAGRFAESEKLFLRSISALATSSGQETEMSTLLNNLGAVYLAEYKNQLAQETGDRALKLWSAQPGAESAGQAFSYTVLAEAYNRQGMAHDAETCFSRVLEIWQATAGPNDVQTAKGLANLGVFYLDSGQIEKAEPLFQRAADIYKTSNSNDMFHLYFLYTYSKLQRKLGHRKEAKELEKRFAQLAAGGAQQQIAKGIVDVSAFRANP